MDEPRFRSLDIVQVADLPTMREDGSAGHEAVVCRVRRYDSGLYSYEVGTLDDSLLDLVAGIYSEECLVETGRRVHFHEVASWVYEPSPTGRHVDLLDADLAVVPGRGYTIVDDLSDHSSDGESAH